MQRIRFAGKRTCLAAICIELIAHKLQLLIPRCDNVPLLKSQFSKAKPYASYLDQHLEFLFRATQGAERPDALQIPPKLRKRAVAELRALETTIPFVTNGKTVLAMAAWFFLLCYADDVVEKMSPRAAQAALQKGVQAMGRPALLIRGKKKVSVSSRAECTVDDGPETKIEGHQLILHSCQTFGRHVRDLLPKPTYKLLLQSVSKVFDGMVEEIEFREHRIPDVNLYLGIRVRTIGLSPFFVLLPDQHFRQGMAKDESFSALEMCVKVAVGMQNDLIGLEKDRFQGEWMNFATIAAMDHISVTDTEDGVLRCVETHNCAIRLALHCWSLLDVGAEEAERLYALRLLQFVGLHFQWAAAAQRYQAEKC